jgi:alkanesulfonate monooxygenase SsuD/methylene tetrahydromethanopterin reductase-like flavin-dependent oxidoreductase (luciferase family)
MKYSFELIAELPLVADGSDSGTPGATARLAERFKYDGILIFYNHRQLDPWILTSALLERTERITPLIALQPYTMPPFSTAKAISSIARLHQRRVDLNIIAGANKSELEQVGDAESHDERYKRAVEYSSIVRNLLSSADPLDFEGRHYRFRGLQMHSYVEPEFRPKIFIAGSSPAGCAAASRIGDVLITHPEPAAAFETDFVRSVPDGLLFGIRIGILARPTAKEAWDIAFTEYACDRAAMIQTSFKQSSESAWSRRLAKLAIDGDIYDDVYWMGAFRSTKGSFPLLVGSYAEVTSYLARYLDAGTSAILLGGTYTAEEFQHVRIVLRGLRGW